MASERDYIYHHIGKCLDAHTHKLDILYQIDHGSVPHLDKNEILNAQEMYFHLQKGMKRASNNSKLLYHLSSDLSPKIRKEIRNLHSILHDIEKKLNSQLIADLIQINEGLIIAASKNDFSLMKELILEEDETIKMLEPRKATRSAMELAKLINLKFQDTSSDLGALAYLIMTALELENGHILNTKLEETISYHIKSVASHILGNRINDLIKIEGCLYAVGKWLQNEGGKFAAEQQMRLSFGPYRQMSPSEFFSIGKHSYSICVVDEP